MSENLEHQSVWQNDICKQWAVWSGSTLFAIPLSILRNSCIKSKIYAKIVRNKVFEMLGHLPYNRRPINIQIMNSN